jgi:thymidylate kinase
MIIELFGPPCSGKTTLCLALAGRLRERGVQAELALSARPAEGSTYATADKPEQSPMSGAVRRIVRPTMELLTIGKDIFGKSTEAVMASDLLKRLPPKGGLSSLRLRRYIWRRADSWNHGRHAGRVLIFDQAFVQVIYSLATMSGRVEEGYLAQALDVVPMPDLLVRLEVPRETLKARLIDRQRGQSGIERWLEVDPEANLRSLGIIESVDNILRQRGQEIVSISTADRRALDDAVRLLEEAVTARLGKVKAVA